MYINRKKFSLKKKNHYPDYQRAGHLFIEQPLTGINNENILAATKMIKN